ncbi:MAG: pyridoxal phosphate-dependent aminotransferase [Candidatus Mcinerneyibacterium aminivorans]|uniref:Aminotransferase n=1 Tax=Candidatus Mcinerneyibacterium aminivorans TaxID=2703815 RepID=A0A5D0MBI6_9BACT|nr:MAG: pyridoxal phosphate-dependent aminotransferase [Candidatus Mcinerneyibacterium aminivorans]
MGISNRMRGIPASPIRKLTPYANEAKKRGIKVYHINIGQPDIKTPPDALKKVKNFNKEVLKYSQSDGIFDLKKSMTDYFNNLHYNINPKNIIVTNGGSEAIYFSFMVSMDTKDEVLIPEPYYANYNGFAKMADVNVKPIETNVENGFKLPSYEKLESYISGKTKAILMCSPNNPTGTVHEKGDYKKIAKLAQKYDLTVIGDEVYNEFVYDNAEHVSVMEFEEIKDRTILIDSVSKRYSACGARIGAFITKNKNYIDAVMSLAQARLCPPTLEQVLAAELYRTDRTYIKNAKNEYRKRRDIVYEELNKIDGIVAHKPSGAFYTVVKLPIDDTEKFAKWLLTDFEENKETVMVAPASGFYASDNRGKNEIRIAYILEEKNMRRSIQLLKKAIEVYNN